jgi:hypothetical protein
MVMFKKSHSFVQIKDADKKLSYLVFSYFKFRLKSGSYMIKNRLPCHCDQTTPSCGEYVRHFKTHYIYIYIHESARARAHTHTHTHTHTHSSSNLRKCKARMLYLPSKIKQPNIFQHLFCFMFHSISTL